jgi:hypothetical protein
LRLAAKQPGGIKAKKTPKVSREACQTASYSLYVSRGLLVSTQSKRPEADEEKVIYAKSMVQACRA